MRGRRELEVFVNGRTLRGQAEPRTTLADFLRDQLGPTGTHLGCEHGAAGPARSCSTAGRSAPACCWPCRRRATS